MSPRSALFIGIAMSLASTASGATHLVLPNGAGDYASIQDALDVAIPGDEIVLGDGTFVGLRNRDLSFLGKNLTLRSQSGDPALCIIDPQGQTRGLSITQGETALVEGITIRNGYHPGLTGSPGAPGWGGGVLLSGVTATFRRCVVTQCSASDAVGSAIGAGVYASGSNVTFEDCAFVDNFFATRGSGAGLQVWGNSAATLRRCRLSGNRAPGPTSGGSGGGIRVQDSRLTLIDCEIVGNSAVTGAGISLGQLCLVDFRNTLVAGNLCDVSPQGTSMAGGIQFGYDTDGTVESCTIVGNRALNRGGGISVANDCNLTIRNTIIWGNCSPPGTGESAYSLHDGAVDFVCSDVDPALVLGGIVTYTNSLAVDPMFCAPQACTSAPTTTGAYTLNAGSPLLDAPGCGRIGRSGVGCGTASVDPALASNGLRVRGAPNPFAGSITIHYAIPYAGPVQVDVFDAAGRLVAPLDQGSRTKGSHTVSWDGRSRDGSVVPPGAYVVRVTSRGTTAKARVVRVE